jgi:hypothetical protein
MVIFQYDLAVAVSANKDNFFKQASQSATMFSVALLFSLVLVTSGSVDASSDSCSAHVLDSCLQPGSQWEEGACNALYGDFRGNSDILHKLMQDHFKESFKFLLMVGPHSNQFVLSPQ